MKCIAAVVMMALVAVSSASVSPLVYSAGPVAAYHGSPLAYAAPYASTYATKYVSAPAIATYASLPESKLVATSYAAHAPVVHYSEPAVYKSVAPVAYHAAPVAYSSYAAPAYTKVVAAPAPLAYHTKVVAAPVHYAAPVVHAPVAYTAVQEEAKYTAVNRGAVHEAPLPGHTLSQTSLNLEPAAH